MLKKHYQKSVPRKVHYQSAPGSPNYPEIHLFVSEKQIFLLEDLLNDRIVTEMAVPFKTRDRHRIVDCIEMTQRLQAVPF